MENSGSDLNLEEFFDPEAEMAALFKSADEIIYPAVMERLNIAKIDYNIASNSYTDMPTRIALAKEYLSTLRQTGSVFGIRIIVIRDICKKRPQLALALEHSAHLTISWLNLIYDLKADESEPNFIPWADLLIRSERSFLNQLRAITDKSKN